MVSWPVRNLPQKMTVSQWRGIPLLAALFLVLAWPSQTLSGPKAESSPSNVLEKLTLSQAVMCEAIKDQAPQNHGVVFSMAMGKVLCFTSFDPVLEKTVIYHNWFHKDELSNKLKLTLQPPRWSTFSTIQLREADKGPWRVEITDQAGHILGVLRFSITD
jgi:hypothetical protein